MISVIMAHYRREELLFRTLWGYRHMHTKKELKNVEFVIVDDDGGQSKTFWKVIKLHKMGGLNITAAAMDEKTHNTSGPMNFAIKLAVGDIFLLTNPENIPVTPHFLPELKKRMIGNPMRHLSGACYSLDEMDTARFRIDIGSRLEFVETLKGILLHERRFGNNGSHSGWRQHSKFFPGQLFFLTAMWRKPLFEMRGFDEDYMKGQAREDVDIVHRAEKHKMEMFHTDDLVVLHQYHFGPGCHKLKPERRSKVAINFETYRKKEKLPTAVRNVGREWGSPKSATRIEKWKDIAKYDEQLARKSKKRKRDFNAAYWSNLYSDLDNYGQDIFEMERQNKLYTRVAGEIEKGLILDVACGVSPFLCAMDVERRKDYYGIDFSSIALEYLLEEHPDLKEHLLKGRCTKLPYSDESFDNVVLCEIIEHLDDADVEKTLAEAWRVLKPDGKIIVTVPSGILSRHESHRKLYYSYDAEELLASYTPDSEVEFETSWFLITAKKPQIFANIAK